MIEAKSSSTVKWISQINESAGTSCGQKVMMLAELAARGFAVPEGFCVTSEAYKRHASSFFLQSREPGKDVRSLAVDYWDMLRVELQPLFVDRVVKEFHLLKNAYPGPVAVRSSSTAEDLDSRSFAGLYETILNVNNDSQLLDAIRRCWASYWSQAAIRYREQAGIDHGDHAMAVLVQTMVRAKFSGVLFTQSTTYQHTDAAVVEYVPGTGENLVSGDLGARRCVVERGSRRYLGRASRGRELDPKLLNRLLSLSFEIEEYLGEPQDIEWCIDDADRIWFLQTRPITRKVDAKVNVPLSWERAYGEPFSPLGCDLAVRRHRLWVEAINDYYKTGFAPEAEVVDGFLYINTSWRSPGPLLRIWMRAWKILRWLSANRIVREYTNSILPTHIERLKRLEQVSVSSVETSDLMRSFDAAILAYLDLQRTSYPNAALASASVAILDRLCRVCFRKGVRFRAPDFLTGLDNLTVDRDLSLHSLGQDIVEIQSKDEVLNLDHTFLVTSENEGNAGNRFRRELERFLDMYGYIWADRYPRDPAWVLNGDALAASLVQVAKSALNGSGLLEQHKRQKQKRAQTAKIAGQRLSLLRPLFNVILRQAEDLFPHKENRNHYVYHAVVVIRKYALEIGRRLDARNVIESERDIFFLTWSEIRKAVRGDVNRSVLRHAIESRKHAYKRGSKRRHGLDPALRPSEFDRQAANDNGISEFVGDPCSSGLSSGRARLVRGFGELDQVKPGDIVVCSNMRPAWSTVLGRAGGIVVETGSLLSHGATLAREYGVPAVMNVPGITRIVHEGDRITVDGSNGILSIERV